MSADASSSNKSLSGKRALVTGSSGGIGKGIALALAKQGARVILHYHTRKDGAHATRKSIIDNGGTCDGILHCDFRSPDAINKMWQIVEEKWNGDIDILVNNAGIVTKVAVEDDAGLSAWHETMAVNLHAPLQLSKLAHKQMKKNSDGGTIVMVSSIHGSISVEWMTAYAASKAALDRLTAGLSSEWAPDGVRVSAVAPGVVPVERTAAVMGTPEAEALWLPHIPVGRFGSVQDIADAVVFLCSSSWTSGSILTVDGGCTARANMPVRPRPPPPLKERSEKSKDTNVSHEAHFEN